MEAVLGTSVKLIIDILPRIVRLDSTEVGGGCPRVEDDKQGLDGVDRDSGVETLTELVLE